VWVIFHDVVPALVEDGCGVFGTKCHRKGTKRLGLALDVLLVRVVHEFDAHTAGNDITEKVRPLPHRVRVPALAFNYLRLQPTRSNLFL
jgi:hypothetical protein